MHSVNIQKYINSAAIIQRVALHKVKVKSGLQWPVFEYSIKAYDQVIRNQREMRRKTSMTKEEDRARSEYCNEMNSNKK